MPLHSFASISNHPSPGSTHLPPTHPAVKTLPQVGRVRTEEAILSTVDHPFLATLYGTLQTGARGWAAAGALGPLWLQEQLLSCLSAPGCWDSAPVLPPGLPRSKHPPC